MGVAAHREAQWTRGFMIQQLDVAFGEGYGFVAEIDFDPVLDLRQQRFRPVDRDRRHLRAFADLARSHRTLEDAIGGDPWIFDGFADIRTPIDPISQIANPRNRPELAFGRTATRGGNTVEETGCEHVVCDFPRRTDPGGMRTKTWTVFTWGQF